MDIPANVVAEVRRLRIAAAVTALVFAALGAYSWQMGPGIFVIPFLLPYVLVALLIPRRGALAWARGMGMILFVISTFYAVIIAFEGQGAERWVLLTAAVVASVTQFVLLRDAGRVWRALVEQGKARGRIGWHAILPAIYVLFFLLVVAAMIPSMVMNTPEVNESAAIGNLRNMHTALISYQTEHPAEGFPKSVTALREWVGEELACAASPCVKRKYRYQYTLLPPDKDGPRFTLTARPVQYGKNAKRAFFVDQTGVLHFTREDREATARDAELK